MSVDPVGLSDKRRFDRKYAHDASSGSEQQQQQRIDSIRTLFVCVCVRECRRCVAGKYVCLGLVVATSMIRVRALAQRCDIDSLHRQPQLDAQKIEHACDEFGIARRYKRTYANVLFICTGRCGLGVLRIFAPAEPAAICSIRFNLI